MIENTKWFGISALAVIAMSCSNDFDEPRVAPAMTEHSLTDAWHQYGGDLQGTRFAKNVKISPKNVTYLEKSWEFQTGDVANGGEEFFGRRSSFKATPVYFRNSLIVSTGFNRVISLNPETGDMIWSYDPQVDFSIEYSEMFTSRGVATGSISGAEGQICAHRVYFGTLDARLISLDADTGFPCNSFGRNGEVDLSRGIKNFREGEYSVTSPPTVVNGVVVVGSSIGDNGSVELDEGTVRAFDAVSGKLRWKFDPVPKTEGAPGREGWQKRQASRTGAGNVWSVMSADPDRDLVFLPTSSPSPDFYGGERAGDNRYTNSIVALRASTGEFVWAYQIVQHDLWDFDLAAQPLLIDLEFDGVTRPALAQATKMGFIFVLDRETGEPLHEVIDIKTPESDVKGEFASPFQKFPKLRLHETGKEDFIRWDRDEAHTAECDRMLKDARYDGIFTPPSLQGSLLYPGNPGGVNWGSMAASPDTGIAIVAINRWPTMVKLIPRKDFKSAEKDEVFNGVNAQFTSQSGTPFGMARFDVFNRTTGLPCHKGPWSTLIAIDLADGEIIWEVPAGIAPGVEQDSPASNWGYFVRGGPMVTSQGVGFLATPFDFMLRAHNLRTGDVLWQERLPAQPGASPMAFVHNEEHYVAITAGGRKVDGSGQGDYVIVYKLISDQD